LLWLDDVQTRNSRLNPIIPQAREEEVENDDNGIDKERDQEDVNDKPFTRIHFIDFKIFSDYAHYPVHSLLNLSASLGGFFNHLLGGKNSIKSADRRGYSINFVVLLTMGR